MLPRGSSIVNVADSMNFSRQQCSVVTDDKLRQMDVRNLRRGHFLTVPFQWSFVGKPFSLICLPHISLSLPAPVKAVTQWVHLHGLIFLSCTSFYIYKIISSMAFVNHGLCFVWWCFCLAKLLPTLSCSLLCVHVIIDSASSHSRTAVLVRCFQQCTSPTSQTPCLNLA